MFLGLASSASAADWPQFRGPTADGLTTETGLPTAWGAEQNIAWKIKVPGVAWSCPVVWGDKIFVTTAISDKQTKPAPMNFGGGGGGGRGGGFGGPPGGPPGGGPEGKQRKQAGEGGFRKGVGGPGGGFGGRGATPPNAVYKWEVYCLDRDSGKVLWHQLATEKKPSIPTHRTNTFASETPITDGERVYAYFGMTGLFCFDFAGKLLWQKDVGSFPMAMGWGTGSSPVLVDDRIVIQCDNEKESFLVAYDKKTGNEVWRVKRDAKSTWSTPYVWKNKLRTELVAAASKVVSYDPANGKVLWEMNGLNSRCSATPVGDKELLFCGAGGGMTGPGPLMAIKAGSTGDITPAEGESTSAGVAWTAQRSGPPMASPLLYKSLLYIPDQRGGMIACHDAKTGKQLYRERIPGGKGFTSSPWAYDDKVFVLDEDGNTFVLEAGPKLKVLGKNSLNEMFWSSPAIAGGALFLRGVDHLFCVKQSKG